MLTNFAPLPEQRYAVIYADPPWDYKGQLQHAGTGSGDSGGAVRHFSTVTTRDLIELPVATIAEPDAVLFLWATSPHLDQAIELGKAWGFAWATVAFVWDKQRVNPGHYTLSQCELCLVFKRGRIPQPRGRRDIRQLVSEPRGRHSEKPMMCACGSQRCFRHSRRSSYSHAAPQPAGTLGVRKSRTACNADSGRR